jgi:hypothetical protein
VALGRDALAGSWVHSHEEDADGERIYRPATFDLPPSRGRDAFELRPDGTAVSRGPGPTDVPEEQRGTWEVRGDDLVLGLSGAERVLHVVSVEPERLVVRQD